MVKITFTPRGVPLGRVKAMSAQQDTPGWVQDMLCHAGSIATSYFDATVDELNVDNKLDEGFDPVTIADSRIETYLRDTILTHCPTDAVSGEEQGLTAGTSGRTWHIDPIDGTKAFMTGMLGWGILVGTTELTDEGEHATAGWLHQPITGEIFSGHNGHTQLTRLQPSRYGNEHLGSTPLHTSSCTTVENAIMYTTHPSMFHGQLQQSYAQLAHRVKLSRFGGDCYSYAMLASGKIDAVVESQLNPYDIIPLISIVQGAGGHIINLHGQSPLRGGTVIAAATQQLAETIQSALH